MAGKVNSHPGQSSLGVRCTHYTTTSDQARRTFGRCFLFVGLVIRIPDRRVIRHEELAGRLLAKALLAIPCHVVQRHEGAVGQNHVVQQARTHDHIVGLFNHVWQGPVGGRLGWITVAGKCVVAADCVIGGWGVYSLLDITTIEVVVGSIAFGRVPKFVIGEGTKVFGKC